MKYPKPCRNCGNMERNKHGSCPTCAERRTKTYLLKPGVADRFRALAIKRKESDPERHKTKRKEYKKNYKMRRRAHEPAIVQRRNIWVPCAVCLARVGFGSVVTSKLLTVSPSTVRLNLKKQGVERYIPPSGSWELAARSNRLGNGEYRKAIKYGIVERKRRRFGHIMRSVLNGGADVFSGLTGCTSSELRGHLQLYFKKGMTWENYGKYWHVDHVIPCHAFDHTDARQVNQCWHFSNLRPLEASRNIRKGARVTMPQMHLLLCATT